MTSCLARGVEEEEEDLFVFNDTIEGYGAPVAVSFASFNDDQRFRV